MFSASCRTNIKTREKFTCSIVKLHASIKPHTTVSRQSLCRLYRNVVSRRNWNSRISYLRIYLGKRSVVFIGVSCNKRKTYKRILECTALCAYIQVRCEIILPVQSGQFKRPIEWITESLVLVPTDRNCTISIAQHHRIASYACCVFVHINSGTNPRSQRSQHMYVHM